MKEGLVLLDNAGVVLSINPAAQRLYGVSRASVGQDFLTIDRSRDMSRAIADAVKNGHSEVRSERGGAPISSISAASSPAARQSARCSSPST